MGKSCRSWTLLGSSFKPTADGQLGTVPLAVVQLAGLPYAVYLWFLLALVATCVPCCCAFSGAFLASTMSDSCLEANWLGKWRCDTPLLPEKAK